MTKLTINGKAYEYAGDPEMPLLWFIRETAGLTGSKYGCGVAQCGACTVYADGAAIRACSTPMSAVEGIKITTIERLSDPAGKAVQKAWNDLNVVQCGFCQSGQIMAAAALIRENAAPSDADIDQAMAGNICRCATYPRIRTAIKQAAASLKG
jgi:isoquinoline 1-oxidoreductase alpha subunit